MGFAKRSTRLCDLLPDELFDLPDGQTSGELRREIAKACLRTRGA
jgi:hypothetical protein